MQILALSPHSSTPVPSQNSDQKTDAAILIQKIWRGYSGRKEADNALFAYAISYIDRSSTLDELEQIRIGSTPVYVLNQLPIVLKKSGFSKVLPRLNQMEVGRQICAKSKYRHLVIPNACTHGAFVIEKKLPLLTHDPKDQIRLYIQHKAQFTDVVKEFTGFLCQSWLTDIVGNERGINYSTLFTCLGRYDNVSLYLDKGKPRIGLVDLEGLVARRTISRATCVSACKNAICFFPHHFEEIFSVGKTFCPDLEEDRAYLEQERDEALEGFKLIYEGHLAFLKNKGITLEDPLKMLEITPDRKENLKQTLLSILRQNRDCLGGNSTRVIEIFEQTFPQVLGFVTRFIVKATANKSSGPTCFEELPVYRTLEFTGTGYIDDEGNAPADNVRRELYLEMKNSGEIGVFSDVALSCIVKNILIELAKGKELAYYNPSLGWERSRHYIFW